MKFKYLFLSFLLVSSSIFSQNCLVGSYPFCGNADDVSGNDFHGIINGAAFTTDRYGVPNSALLFDGINDWIQISDDSLFNFSVNQEFTISLWVQMGQNQALVSGNSRNIILDKFYDSGTNTYGFPYSIRVNNQATSRNGMVSLYRKDASGCSNKPEARSDSLINDSLWHNIVMVREDTMIKLYIDALLDTVIFDYTVCSTKNAYDLYFGAKGGSSNRGFYKGALDDVKIYDCAFDSSEVLDLYWEDSYCRQEIIICPGDSIYLGKEYRSQPGTYLDSFQNFLFRDSLVYTVLLVDSIFIGNDSTKICFGDSAFIFGKYESQQGIYIDTMQNKNGCDSILTHRLDVDPLNEKYSSIEICYGDSILIGGKYYKSGGVYKDTISYSFGCDTLNNITLSIKIINPSIFLNKNLLYTNYHNASYQWMECVSGQIIPGANSINYTVSQNGTYAVIVTQDGCIDTSNCITITYISVNELDNGRIKIYPNPVSQNLYIKSNENLSSVQIYNSTGQVIEVLKIESGSIDVSNFKKGLYFLKYKVKDQTQIYPFYKE